MQQSETTNGVDAHVAQLERENADLRDYNYKLQYQDRVKDALISQMKQELQYLRKNQASSLAESTTNPLSTSALVTATHGEPLEVYEDNIGYTVATAMQKSYNEFMAKRMSLRNQDNEIQYTIQRLKDQWDNGEYKQVKW